MPLASKSPYPIIVYSVINYRPYILVTFKQIWIFRDPDLVTFYFYELTHFFTLYEEHFTFHLQNKHSGKFANRKQELSYHKKSENVRPHSSNSIENATPLYTIQPWKCGPNERHIPSSLL